MHHKVCAVIFDWAGTTVDYGCFAPVKAFSEAFLKQGIEVTMDEIRKPMGKQKFDHIQDMLNMPRIASLWMSVYGRQPLIEDANALYTQFEKSLFEVLHQYCEVIPGVLETVEKIRNLGIKIGSTTGYTKEMMDVLVPEAQKNGYSPDAIVTPDEAHAGRPHPYMVYANAIKLQKSPLSSFVKVGDTIADIDEAVNAGIWSVGVIKGSSQLGLSLDEMTAMDEQELVALMEKVRRTYIAAGAHYVIEDITELIEVLYDINAKLQIGVNPLLA